MIEDKFGDKVLAREVTNRERMSLRDGGEDAPDAAVATTCTVSSLLTTYSRHALVGGMRYDY